MKYTLITVDGVITVRQRMSLKQMQKFVGGYIELVNAEGQKFYCNEDGLRLELSRNKLFPILLGNIIMEVK